MESSAATGPLPAPSGASSRLWRLSNFVMAVFFGLAGAVQVGGRPVLGVGGTRKAPTSAGGKLGPPTGCVRRRKRRGESLRSTVQTAEGPGGESRELVCAGEVRERSDGKQKAGRPGRRERDGGEGQGRAGASLLEVAPPIVVQATDTKIGFEETLCGRGARQRRWEAGLLAKRGAERKPKGEVACEGEVNDPDPGLWIVAYAVPAALTLVVSLNPPIADNIVWRSLSDLHSSACVVGSAILGYSLLANAQKNILHEEEGRELSGLVIVTIWMSLCRSSAKNTLGGVRLAIAIFLSLFPFVMWLYIYVNAEIRASWPSHCKTVI